MGLKILHFFTVMLFALVAGVFWGTWFSLSRSISAITAQTFLETGQTIIRNLAVPMRFLMPGAILLSLATLLFLPGKSSAFFFSLLAAVLMIVRLSLLSP